MTAREKELRTKIGAECLQKKWRNDYLTSCFSEYNFDRCPDEFECMDKYTENFECDYLSTPSFNCKECWKKFLRGEEC